MFDCVGLKLGNYRLMHMVGHGGFADVYQGEHVYLKTEAAIKVLHTQVPGKLLQNFLIEARNHARLNHPNIVHVLDFGIEDNIPFLVMHYASNGTLRQRHPTGSILEPSLIVSYVKQITAALQYAHTRKIIHRDIKPENMLLNDEDAIMLSDFGIAIALRSLHNTNKPVLFSLSTLTAGTTTYMAPEQFSGAPHYASDQYALATAVYEWFCGTPPFTGSDLQIAVKHMYKQPPFMREILPALDPAIERVVMKALAKNPQQRFASVQDFSDALEGACRPLSPRLYSLAKALEPSIHSVDSINPSLKVQHASNTDVTNQKTSLSVLDHLALFPKTISMPLVSRQSATMAFRHPSAPLPVQPQSQIFKRPPLLAPVSTRQTKNSWVTPEHKKGWLLLAILIFCLSGIISLSLISFTQIDLQPAKKQVQIVVTTMPQKILTNTVQISHVKKVPLPIQTPQPRVKATQIPTPQPTLPRITPTPPIPPTPPTQILLTTPSSFSTANCIPDNRTYRCTVTLSLRPGYTGQLAWHAYAIHIHAYFNLKHGTLSPGQSQQIIIYVSHKCQEDSSLVFTGGGTSISLPWSC